MLYRYIEKLKVALLLLRQTRSPGLIKQATLQVCTFYSKRINNNDF